MRIVVDRNTPLAEQVFRTLGDVTAIDTREFSAGSVRDADILVIRSETRVNADLLAGSRVRFVGTTTIGTDHVDTQYLSAHGIGFASAPGSNANSVAEYIACALLTAGHRLGFSLKGSTLGVVGVGNTGSRVARAAETLGMTVLQNDPPLARATGEARFLPLDELMRADVISLHVPLNRAGTDPTFHLFDAKRLAAMKPGSVLINASRGGVVETGALKNALGAGKLAGAVLDVWEGEPSIDAGLLSQVVLGTPHVAGYSLDGKVNAVRIIYHAVCKSLGVQPVWEKWDALPPPSAPWIEIAPGEQEDENLLRKIVTRCYDIELDDRNLRNIASVPESDRAAYFQRLRTGYRVRREFAATTITIPAGLRSTAAILASLGFAMSHLGLNAESPQQKAEH